MAVIDYEPTGVDGFCDKAVKRFQEEYQISADKFAAFRRYFSAQKLQTHNSKDPAISAIYERWKQFNSQQTSAYIKPVSYTHLDVYKRQVVEREGTLLMVDDERMPLAPSEVPQQEWVRFRTLGCYPLTGAVRSRAATLPEIIQEMLLTRHSERQGRLIDHDAVGSMEEKKRQGYF